jgi:DNA-binding MarR family transcriptional regulator
MSSKDPDGQIAAVRAFNRFYTRKLGVLDQHVMQSPFSLSEGRVLYELAHREELAAKEIGTELGLDAGYLSRIVQKFDEDGLITRKPLASDRRQFQLSLTGKGRQAYAKLDRSSQHEVGAMLAALAPDDRARLTGAMATIERLLGEARNAAAILREPQPGDMGLWCRQRRSCQRMRLRRRLRGAGRRHRREILDLVRRLARALLDRGYWGPAGRLGVSGPP